MDPVSGSIRKRPFLKWPTFWPWKKFWMSVCPVGIIFVVKCSISVPNFMLLSPIAQFFRISAGLSWSRTKRRNVLGCIVFLFFFKFNYSSCIVFSCIPIAFDPTRTPAVNHVGVVGGEFEPHWFYFFLPLSKFLRRYNVAYSVKQEIYYSLNTNDVSTVTWWTNISAHARASQNRYRLSLESGSLWIGNPALYTHEYDRPRQQWAYEHTVFWLT